MNKLFITFLICAFALFAKGQTVQPAPTAPPYGKVDIADLEMTSCDFEKDANAEVLLDIGKIYYEDDLKSIIQEYHRRIKIFNSKGNDAADIHLSYISFERLENITGVEAETINLVDGKEEVTKLDKKSIFFTNVDQERSEVRFTFPNVKPGCIIEFKYKRTARYNAEMPSWDFQEEIPVRYSELNTSIPDVFFFRVQPHISLPLILHTTSTNAQVLKEMSHTAVIGGGSLEDREANQQTASYNYNNNIEVWGMANIPSVRVDAYISSFADNTERITFDYVGDKPIGGTFIGYSDTWAKVGGELAVDDDFGSQLNRSLTGEDGITAKAALLKTKDEQIACIFNEVKNTMKWNGNDRWYTVDGTHKAWDNKSGNSTEINLILYHLLKRQNIEAYPMVVSTRSNGRADRWRTSVWGFNRTVVYIPIDSTKNYVLDATDKYNVYNETPPELLNSFGLWIDKAKKLYDTVSLKRDLPVRQVVLINAEIKPGGKMEGTAQISSMSYDRMDVIKRYKTDGEKIFIDSLRGGDNNLKISSVKFENMETDTLPLTQNIAFSMDMAGSDENYIYLKPNLFTSLKTNPFLSESRMTDIYFGYLRSYSVNGVFKIPAGYKIDVLPKSVSMAIPDKSIVFKRIVAEQDGSVLVHYVIDLRRPAFNASEYAGVHDFFKKMYEMLNEQIVLKKS
jgi:hypothetical protein